MARNKFYFMALFLVVFTEGRLMTPLMFNGVPFPPEVRVVRGK